MTTQASVRDGCRRHAMSEAEVQRWWQVAADRDLVVGMCVCCFAPCPPDRIDSRCKRCQEQA